jgi:hypothetical protein
VKPRDESDQVELLGADRAEVDQDKICEYQLSAMHPIGRFKAAFFGGLGYSVDEWAVFAEHLRRHAVENDATATAPNEYGQEYEETGRLAGPTGKSAVVVAVWIVLRGENHPRFVTAFPGTKP